MSKLRWPTNTNEIKMSLLNENKIHRMKVNFTKKNIFLKMKVKLTFSK